MFNYLDFNNDRSVVREKFINEAHKKTTLADIGRALDRFIINEKAEMLPYWQLSKEEKIKSASKDLTSNDFTWSGSFFGIFDPLRPSKVK